MKNTYIGFCIALIPFIFGCKKEFLDKKPSTKILQPSSLSDFQNLLENIDVTNTTALNILCSDEYVFRSYSIWQSTNTATERNAYIWAKDLYSGETNKKDWNLPYKAIFYANSVLANLPNIKVTDINKNNWNMIKGWALFVRANAYYDLVRNFSPAYNATTADTDLGLPLRLEPSVGQILERSSVQKTYDRILTDLNEATDLLESSLPATNKNRPSKVASYALAARIYLNMRDYVNAELNADNCLRLYNKLIDYNTLSLTSATPFQTPNDELIYLNLGGEVYSSYLSTTVNSYTVVSMDLINLYQPNDLRLTLLFIKQSDGKYIVKRNISGIVVRNPFTGLATDEVYLIKAECAARRSEKDLALDFLNKLLIKRYATSQFIPLTASSASEALVKVLLERRKELVYRALRWDDLKRLNMEGANITLTRELNGQTYMLEPNSPKYVLPIPDDEISLSGIQQNQR
jgi:hypothetical protein